MDYSEWLTPERLAVEEGVWAACEYYRDFAQAIQHATERWPINSVVEFGCGTGWVPSVLNPKLGYTGVDNNYECVYRAAAKCPNRVFHLGDLRTYDPPAADLGCAFSVLKHFAFAEWYQVVRKVLYAPFGVFTMPVKDLPLGEQSLDDGVEWPHLWVSPPVLVEAVHRAGHRVVESVPQRSGETLVFTERVVWAR